MRETITISPRATEGRRSGRGRLVLAFDCARPLAPPEVFPLDQAAIVYLGGGERREVTRTCDELRIVLPDAWMSRQHVRLLKAGGTWRAEDLGSKNGTWVNGLRMDRAPLQEGDVIETGGSILMGRWEATPPPRALDPRPALRTLVPDFAEDLATLERVARSSVPVLLSGETGTGKELLARAVHELSGRRGPFVPVNCGALPQDLVESELFGARRGAFSGAVADRRGLLVTAHGGTLFLDEIAELRESAQAALLRALQEGEVRPLGSAEPTHVDLRLVAATHEDLAARVEAGRFRRDLYARLRGYRFTLPPLRERREDLGMLVAEIVRRVDPARAERLVFSRDAARALFAHDWPLNVRELENALRTACAIISADEIDVAHLPPELRKPPRPPVDDEESFRALVRAHHGNVTAIAEALRTSRTQVRRIARRYGINLSAERGE